MRYRLTKNAYLTVMREGCYQNSFNRHFEKGEVFEKVASVNGNYVVLAKDDIKLFISRRKLQECFELIWECEKYPGESLYCIGGDDGTEETED